MIASSFPSARRIRAERFVRSDISRSLNIYVTVEVTISVKLVSARGDLRSRRTYVVTAGSKYVFGDSNILPHPSSRTDMCVIDEYRRLIVLSGAFSKRRIFTTEM